MRAAVLLSLTVLAAAAGEARADQAPGLHPPDPAVAASTSARPSWMYTVGGVLRATRNDADADDDIGRLEQYGWVAERAPLLGLRGDVAYLNAPIVDVGVAWTWARARFAQGPAYDDPDTIVGSTLEMGAFARVHWVRPRSPVAVEPRVELGVARTTTTMRGVSDHEVSPYTRVGVDARLGGKRAGVLLSFDYTRIADGDAALSVPTGGITYGLSFYWRHWP
jgi:hypothetical protein